jgi:aspartate/methionine/tyrosine aminotransferase
LIFPRLTFTGDAEAFCLDLLEKKGVLLLPGNKFNYSNQYIRLGFGRKNMPQALEKLEEYINFAAGGKKRRQYGIYQFV